MDALRDFAARGRAAWPGLNFDEEVFYRQVVQEVVAAKDPASLLTQMRPDDLYLARACAAGDSVAISTFETHFAKLIDRAVAPFARSADAQELKQILRERLFVAPPGGTPRIAKYAGRGFLENWLRVAAVRTFVNAIRSRKDEKKQTSDSVSALADGKDLELDFLKTHYRDAFRHAFARAAKALSAGDRLILRLTLVHKLDSDALGVALGVHRATAARRAVRARQALLDGTRRELFEALRVNEGELTSILRLVESQLELSLSRVFDTATPEDA